MERLNVVERLGKSMRLFFDLLYYWIFRCDNYEYALSVKDQMIWDLNQEVMRLRQEVDVERQVCE